MKSLLAFVCIIFAPAVIWAQAPATQPAALSSAAPLSGQPLTLGVTDPMALENACPCLEGYAQRNYTLLAQYLTLKLRRPVEVSFSASLTVIQQKLGHAPDFIIGNSTLIKHEARAGNIPITQLAMLSGKDGSTRFKGLFVARSKDSIRTLADARGRKIVLGPADRDEKYSLAIEALKQAGVEVAANPATAGDCKIGAAMVARGDADVAAISSYAMPLLTACKAIAPGELKIIGETKSLPFVGAYVTDRVSPATTADIRNALNSVADDKELLKVLESRDGFVVVSHDVNTHDKQ